MFAISHAVTPPCSSSCDETQTNQLQDPRSQTSHCTQAGNAAGAGSRCTSPGTGANPCAHTVTWMTPRLIQPSQHSCACPEPTPGAGQDPTLPRACWPLGKSTGPASFTPGNFTWSSCNRLFCAKLKQCVVLACCILYKNPFPPHPLFKTFI